MEYTRVTWACNNVLVIKLLFILFTHIMKLKNIFYRKIGIPAMVDIVEKHLLK